MCRIQAFCAINTDVICKIKDFVLVRKTRLDLEHTIPNIQLFSDVQF